MNKKIVILTSLVGYGTYVPAICLYNDLIKDNYDVDFLVYEDFFNPTQKKALEDFRTQFHGNFRYAKMSMNVFGLFNNGKINASEIHKIWTKSNTNVFLIFSGRWQQIVLDYKCANKIIEEFRVDCVDTPSWKGVNSIHTKHWLISGVNRPVKVRIRNNKPTRKKDITSGLIHGGGWGIGNIVEVLSADILKRYNVNVILQESEQLNAFSNARLFYNYKKAYIDSKGEYCVPKVKEFSENQWKTIDTQELLKDIDFIISKPGGGTCLDCLNFGIPVIFLEPVALHEKENASFFVENGLGIYFEDWVNDTDPSERLLRLNNNICDFMSETQQYTKYIKENIL